MKDALYDLIMVAVAAIVGAALLGLFVHAGWVVLPKEAPLNVLVGARAQCTYIGGNLVECTQRVEVQCD